MLAISERWKETINKDSRDCRAYLQIDDYNGEVLKLTDDRELIDIEWSHDVIDKSFIGSFPQKRFDIQILNLAETTYNFNNKFIKVYTGLKYSDNTEEYIYQGKVFVKNATYDDVSKVHKLECYDLSLLFDVPFDNGNFTFPMTKSAYVEAICAMLNIEYDLTDFYMGDELLAEQPYLESSATFSDAIRQIAQSSMSVAVISDDKLKFITPYRENAPLVSITDFFSLETKEKVGPFNVLVLGRSPQEDNVYYPTIIPENPKEFRIDNNYLIDPQGEIDLRPAKIGLLAQKIIGYEYIPFNVELIKGRPEIEVLDYLSFTNMKEELQTSTIFKVIHKFNGNFTTTLVCDFESNTNTDYKRGGTLNEKINDVSLRVDKNEGNITALTKDVSNIQDEFGNYYTIEKVNELIQNAESGLTNTFTQTGGTNLLRNTAPYFMISENEAEYWNGNVKQMKEVNSASGFALLIQNGTLTQTIDLAPNQYAIKFHYKRLLVSATAIVKYNGRTIELEEEGTIETTGTVNSGKFEFRVDCNIDDGYEIYDLMLNVGYVASAWTQNANESTSDTVNISKGITVSSNTTNTNAKMDSDGFRVINKSTGETVMEGTDEGGKFNKVEAEKGTIGGVIIQKVGNQTWISGV